MNVYLITAAVIAGALILLWLLSLKLKDASIVDIFWGLGFVLIAATSYRLADGFADRKLLLTALVAVWGGRLAGYLGRRNIGKGEDYRYQAMRRRHGDRFPLVSLFLVFGLQGVLMWIISLPLQAAQMAPQPDRLTPLDWLGVLLWGVGFLFETIGDWQLSRFKADPANRGKVMDRGLWAYTRHPNYFGDAVLWWGYFLIAAAAGAWWTIVSPVVMTLLLMNVSGVALLEKTLVKTKPEYQDYVRRTSAFVPWFPRS
jgi:steroid 5-alpha reductase family enzyme